ncbi:MAG: hypothetical protein QOD35_1086 [Nocardioidaceae bacterium]|nr:hypothetical protein [Nocardioidaceae bacterium]
MVADQDELRRRGDAETTLVPYTASASSPTAVRTSGISVAGNSPSTTARAVACSTAGSCNAFSTAARTDPSGSALSTPHTVHRHVDVKLPQAVGAEPGERVCGSLRSTRLRGRAEVLKKRRKVGLCLGPWAFGRSCLGVAAQRKEH